MQGGEFLPQAVSASLSSARRGPSRWGTRQRVPLRVALCLCSSLAWTTAGLAQVDREQTGGKEDKRIVRISGEVRDAAHRPVAEATVWLAESDARAARLPERVAETRSGADGAFSFFRPVEKETTLSLIARDAKGRLGWNASYIRPGLNTIRLYDVRDVRGRIVDGDGRPIAGARVAPQGFVNLPAGQRVSADWTELFAELAPAFETRTAADGGFVLSKIPEQAHVRCEVSAPGFGKPMAVFAAKDAVTIKLRRTGGLSGSLGPLDGVDADKGGYKLRVTRQNPEAETAAEEGEELSYAAELTTGAGGAFQGGDLPPGRYEISPVAGQGRPFIASPKIYAEVKPNEKTLGVCVPLAPTARVTGRVIDRETRQGIAGVEISAYQPNDRGRPGESQQVTTGDDGRFEVRLPPSAVFVRVMSAPRKFFAPEFDYQNPQPRPIADGEEWPTFELSRAAEVEGVVVDDAGQPAPHAELFLDGISRASVSPFDWLPDRTDGNGRFVIGQLDPELKFSLRARTPDAVSDGMATVAVSDLNGPAKIAVSKQHVFRVRGKVVDGEGRPLPEATVSLEWSREVLNDRAALMARRRDAGFPVRRVGSSYRRSQLEPFAADAEGKFESSALWPRDTYQATISAPGYASLQTASVQGAAGGVHDFGTLVLRRNDLVVSGVVVDDNGQAVADAEIAVVLPAGSPRPAVRSDGQGRFAVSGVDASVPLALRARTAAATTNGATVVLPADFGKPATLAVSPSNAFRLRGTLLDRQGRPAPGASVSVVWDRRGADEQTLRRFVSVRPIGPKGGQATLDQVAAAADGSFETPPLWPDENYRLVASAPGFAANESAVVYGPAGGLTSLEPLVLTRNNLALAGRVVDSGGRPLAGVAVSNSGDADKPLVSTTGADGRFALAGLYEGPAYLLARLPGYRKAGWRGAAGGPPIEIVLRADDEPIRRVAPPKLDDAARFAADRELARRLLDEVWALRERFDDNPRGAAAPRFGRTNHGSPAQTAARAARCMARLDLNRALAWSASEGGLFDEIVRVEAVAADFENDVDRALALLRGMKTYAARSALLAMARREIAAGKHEQATRLLEAALATAPSESAFMGANNQVWNESDLATARAQVGALAIRAERAEWGAKLLTQAADAAEKWAGEDAMTRGRVAAALAPLDPQRSLRILRPIEGQVNFLGDYSYAGQAAATLAPTDLNRAREFLNLLRPGPLADRARMHLACRLAERDCQAALEMVDAMSPVNVRDKADALRWIAVAISPRDPEQAHRLLDRALELCLDVRTRRGGSFGGPPLDAAWIAVAARTADYPDLPGLIDCVLASRARHSGASSAAREVAATIHAARVLALVDPAVARELLTSIETKTQLITPAGDAATDLIGRGEWLQAWALADLQAAERRCDEELDELKKQSTIDTATLALLPLVELLATPPSERQRYLLRSIDPRYWFPGDDEP